MKWWRGRRPETSFLYPPHLSHTHKYTPHQSTKLRYFIIHQISTFYQQWKKLAIERLFTIKEGRSFSNSKAIVDERTYLRWLFTPHNWWTETWDVFNITCFRHISLLPSLYLLVSMFFSLFFFLPFLIFPHVNLFLSFSMLIFKWSFPNTLSIMDKRNTYLISG